MPCAIVQPKCRGAVNHTQCSPLLLLDQHSSDIVFIRNLCSMMITSASVACWSCSLSLSFRVGNDHANILQGKENNGEAAPELPRAHEERRYEEPASVQVSIFR